jgi:hypothetical protein
VTVRSVKRDGDINPTENNDSLETGSLTVKKKEVFIKVRVRLKIEK